MTAAQTSADARPGRTIPLLFTAYALGCAALGVAGVVAAVALFERGGTAGWATVGAIIRVAPFVLLSALAGALADRSSPSRALGAALAGQVVGGVALLAVAPGAPLVAVAVVGFLAHAVWAPAYPAISALVPRLVAPGRLLHVNGTLSTIETIAWVAGPGIGGAAVAAVGVRSAAGLGAIAGGLGLVAFLLSGVHARAAHTGAGSGRPGLLASVRDGAAALVRTKAVLLAVALHLVTNFVGGAVSVLLLVAASTRFGMEGGGYGILTGALAAGSFLAVLALRRVTGAGRPLSLLAVAVLLSGAPIAFLAVVDAPAPAVALVAVSGVGAVMSEALALTMVQRTVPAHMVARVFGVLDAVTVGTILLGSAVTGPLVAWLGVPHTMVVIGTLIPAALVLVLPLFTRAGQRPSVLLPAADLLAALPLLYLARPSTSAAVADAGLGTPPASADAPEDTPVDDLLDTDALDDAHDPDAAAPGPVLHDPVLPEPDLPEPALPDPAVPDTTMDLDLDSDPDMDLDLDLDIDIEIDMDLDLGLDDLGDVSAGFGTGVHDPLDDPFDDSIDDPFDDPFDDPLDDLLD